MSTPQTLIFFFFSQGRGSGKHADAEIRTGLGLNPMCANHCVRSFGHQRVPTSWRLSSSHLESDNHIWMISQHSKLNQKCRTAWDLTLTENCPNPLASNKISHNFTIIFANRWQSLRECLRGPPPRRAGFLAARNSTKLFEQWLSPRPCSSYGVRVWEEAWAAGCWGTNDRLQPVTCSRAPPRGITSLGSPR